MKNFKDAFVFLIIIGFISPVFAEITSEQKDLLESLPPDQRQNLMLKMEQANTLQEDIGSSFKEESILVERPNLEIYGKDPNYCEDCIYGYNLFRFSPSTFAPANQVPVSSSYTLGPGDKLEIIYYGSDEAKVESFISRDGNINLPTLGPVSVAGMSFATANTLIQKRVKEELIGVTVALSLTELRSITVYILGEAFNPGSYTLSALSNVTNALFISGGVSKEGSLRNIQIKRRGEVIKTYDFYNILLKGDTSSDFRLQDGDTIFIPFIENKFVTQGAFKRSAVYEFKEGESVEDAIKLAGGFKSFVSKSPRVEISRIDREANIRRISYLEGAEDFITLLEDSDVIGVSEISGLNAESISLSGEVLYPGTYSISKGDNILDIINRAGGYTSKAYPKGAVFTRSQVADQQKLAFERTADSLENTIINIISTGEIAVDEFTLSPLQNLIQRLRTIVPLGRQVVDVDILDLKQDPYLNFSVSDGDSLYLPQRPESVSVVGEVLSTITQRYNPELSINDYLELSGGITDQADKNKIFVILPNGQSIIYKKSYFNSSSNILPGSTIVVSRDTRPFDAIQLTRIITPILADLATSAAAIAAISNN